jgi:hypothetical protein|tara:strand:- start:2444 stop:3229 length:786 start_codon:yes stop_codon:yes gene_type:complete
MATLINDEQERQQDDIPDTLDDFAVVDEPTQAEEVEEVPEKYRNKTAAELVKMHQEAESLSGRQSNEVGELRKVVDNFITQQTELSQSTENNDEEIDYFTDPEKAIAKAIEKHPYVKEAQKASKEMAITSTRAALLEKHPKMGEYFQDPKFAEWVQNSTSRTSRLRDANENFNYEAADDVFSQWEERQDLISQTMSSETDSRKASSRAAATGSTRASSTGNGGGGKIYRRMDIIKLMKDDPNRYEKLGPEIRKAYAEGRVK